MQKHPLTAFSIGDVQYPRDRPAESIAIKVLGNMYEIKTQYHSELFFRPTTSQLLSNRGEEEFALSSA